MPEPCVAVLGGTGQQGRGLAQRLAIAGFPTIVGSRDAGRAAAAVADWPAAARPQATRDYAAAIADADIIVLAVPFASVDAVIDEQQRHFKPAVLVVDVTVPLVAAGGALTLA